jgi:hypothetical protein
MLSGGCHMRVDILNLNYRCLAHMCQAPTALLKIATTGDTVDTEGKTYMGSHSASSVSSVVER